MRLVILACCLIPACLIAAVAGKLSRELKAQTLAQRFDKSGKYAQVSAFITDDYALDKNNLPIAEYGFVQALEKAGVDISEETGRTYLYGYSKPVGPVFISGSKGSAAAEATAVGGDFFMFHPYELCSGTYFDTEDVNGDGVILDTDTAWTLFGSSNVAGMQVDIGGRIYPVRGVIRRDTGLFTKASGEDDSMIFISYGVADSMLGGGEYGEKTGITCFEILMKNPVRHFAYDTLKKVLEDSYGVQEGSCELVENSSRFSLLSELKVVLNMGKRSMKTNSVTYPGWENRARGYEDVVSVLTLVKCLLFIYPIVIIVIYAIRLVKILKEKIKKLIASIRKKADDKYLKKWLERQETNV